MLTCSAAAIKRVYVTKNLLFFTHFSPLVNLIIVLSVLVSLIPENWVEGIWQERCKFANIEEARVCIDRQQRLNCENTYSTRSMLLHQARYQTFKRARGGEIELSSHIYVSRVYNL